MLTFRVVSALAAAFLLVFLSACSTQKSNLRSADSFSIRTTADPFLFDSVAGLMNVHTIIVLREGQYQPVGQDDVGVWYLGSPKNLVVAYTDAPKSRSDGKLPVATYQGGIFVPHEKGQVARIFFIPETESIAIMNPGTDLKAMASSSKGDAASLGLTLNLIDASVIQEIIARPQLSPLNAGLAGGLAAGVAGALTVYEAKGFKFHPASQPKATSLRSWLLE